jgi:hypothetical protein
MAIVSTTGANPLTLQCSRRTMAPNRTIEPRISPTPSSQESQRAADPLHALLALVGQIDNADPADVPALADQVVEPKTGPGSRRSNRTVAYEDLITRGGVKAARLTQPPVAHVRDL